MIAKEVSKDDEIILSKGDKKYKFTFQLINKNEMLIKAEEEVKGGNVLIPYTYQKLLTIDDLPKREDISISNMKITLSQIKFSHKNNKLEFELEEKKNIKLYFYYFGDEEEKEEIIIPFAYKTDNTDIIYTLSSKLSQSQKSFEKVFNKLKALKKNINSAKAFNIKLKNKENFQKNLFNNQKHEIENIINNLKNYIKTFDNEISLNKKSSEDNFNEIKAQQLSISSKLDTQSDKINTLIQQREEKDFKDQKEHIQQIAKEISQLNDKFTDQTLSLKEQKAIISEVEEANKKLNDKFFSFHLFLKQNFRQKLEESILLLTRNDAEEKTVEINDFINEIIQEQTEGSDGESTEENKCIDDKVLNILNQIRIKINSIFQDDSILNELNKILINKINFSLFLNQLKVIKTISTSNNERINSLCLLEDKRLVSGGDSGVIIVYDDSHKPQIQIQNYKRVDDLVDLVDLKYLEYIHRNCGGLVCAADLNHCQSTILSLCVLRNGDLVASFEDKMIKIWKKKGYNYEPLYILEGHTDCVSKVIELEDGKICSCSYDKTIKIWDKFDTYRRLTTLQAIETLKGHTDLITSIIEMNDYIISVSCKNDSTLRKWSKSTYECIQIIQNVSCCCCNALEKLNYHTVLVGGCGALYVVDIESSEVKQLYDDRLGFVNCFRVIRNDLVLFGNQKGEICEYNPSSNQITSKSKFHNQQITCLIGTEDNQLISSSDDKTISIYQYNYD